MYYLTPSLILHLARVSLHMLKYRHKRTDSIQGRRYITTTAYSSEWRVFLWCKKKTTSATSEECVKARAKNTRLRTIYNQWSPSFSLLAISNNPTITGIVKKLSFKKELLVVVFLSFFRLQDIGMRHICDGILLCGWQRCYQRTHCLGVFPRGGLVLPPSDNAGCLCGGKYSTAHTTSR